jgi:hypothetical protein
MEEITKIESLVATLREEGTKFFEGGNKAAGTRARKTALEIRNLCNDVRKAVSEAKNS